MRERIWMAIAWRLPKQLVKWAAVRLVASATQQPDYTKTVPELTAIEALQRWK